MRVDELMAKLRHYPADAEIMSKPFSAHGKIIVFVEGNSLDPIFQIEPLEKNLENEKPKTTLTDGRPVYPEHREARPDGMQKDYVVLAEEERAKGFVRPVRVAYKHLKCGGITTMSLPIAETYARDPKFYSGTFCYDCRANFPVGENGEFVWVGTDEKVGT